MATKHTDTCLQRAGDDEPIFVLRANDKLAPSIIREWAVRAVEAGTPVAKADEACALAATMEQWQIEHVAKIPD